MYRGGSSSFRQIGDHHVELTEIYFYAILFGELKLISIFALRKNIGDLFSISRRLLESKRALYFVNTFEEFLYAYGGAMQDRN